ncbi:hypothetical protein BaRGS_00020520, partial [Batillaria attramentaria]
PITVIPQTTVEQLGTFACSTSPIVGQSSVRRLAMSRDSLLERLRSVCLVRTGLNPTFLFGRRPMDDMLQCQRYAVLMRRRSFFGVVGSSVFLGKFLCATVPSHALPAFRTPALRLSAISACGFSVPVHHSVERRSYSRDQLLSFRVVDSPVDRSLIPRLRDLGIGRLLPRKRSKRGGRRKQRKIPVISNVFAGTRNGDVNKRGVNDVTPSDDSEGEASDDSEGEGGGGGHVVGFERPSLLEDLQNILHEYPDDGQIFK